MKKILILLSLGLFYPVHATNTQILDTIYANSTMTMALFFPSDIKQGITGSEHFVFTYNREKEQNLGLLKAVKGPPSNLLVITTDGKVYSYILRYAEHLENPNRFISVQESIGDAKRRSKEEIQLEEDIDINISVNDSPELLRRSCESLLNLPEEKHIRKKEGEIVLTLKNLKYHGDNVFLQFEIENKSGMRFDFDYLKIYKVNGNKKRNASYQELPLEPVYVHNKPSQIIPNTKVRMVYVVPKFTIAKNEKIVVRLKELHTSRGVNLIKKKFN
ncbi:DUF4138 domain-containing protein [Flagellimonas sp. CMM7]|uniref:DUF4138 domain-containing protein n=1 Tax=Flagellimonas sp. CMM7 TaxID=2654676 RepID=UPI0013D2A83F|nr:DUF4138 domain-containing protein [Flagellimonas sp. CMM7]UII80104.1 conjugative transposon protein TraN [Flagellimonas sp. CMM7]